MLWPAGSVRQNEFRNLTVVPGYRRAVRTLMLVVLGAVASPLATAAQTPDSTARDTLRSSIKATVRDSLGYPVAAAACSSRPGATSSAPIPRERLLPATFLPAL